MNAGALGDLENWFAAPVVVDNQINMQIQTFFDGYFAEQFSRQRMAAGRLHIQVQVTASPRVIHPRTNSHTSESTPKLRCVSWSML